MPIDFSSTQAIRNDLLRRNLNRPYGVNTALPIQYTQNDYQTVSDRDVSVIPSEKIDDRGLKDVLAATSKNAYNILLPYVLETLPSIHIELNRRGLYPVFTHHYKYEEFLGKKPNMDTSFEETGDITGGFTWRSKNIKNPIGDTDSNFDRSLSTNYDFRDDSILNQTQKLLNSTPKGGSGRGHVGNAIDQTSRVFFDGRKMISKGSGIKYVDKFNQSEAGAEYARVWTKDKPYIKFGHTMKTKGNHRKFKNSVLDSPFNLNIAPQNGSTDFEGSTNILKTGDGFVAKKYMFSIENLAWASSNRYGFRYEDLPYCERGPNGGRVMWFPPYGLQVNEQNTSRWNDNSFVGRVEPIYTWQNAERTGTLSFKVVVDHPSILNLLVRKKFSNMSDQEANNWIDAFFAGAVDVDLYDLAQEYTTLDKDDLERILAYLNGNKPTSEIYTYGQNVLPSNEPIISSGSMSETAPIIGLYGHNETTFFNTSDESSYLNDFNNGATAVGLSTELKTTYLSDIEEAFSSTTSFEQNLNDTITSLKKNLKEGNIVIVKMYSGQSQFENAGISYNRAEALKNYILNQLSDLKIIQSGEVYKVTYATKNGMDDTTELRFDISDNKYDYEGKVDCSADISQKTFNNALLEETISNAFYCRRIMVSLVIKTLSRTEKVNSEQPISNKTIKPSVPSLDEVKRILMKLLGECYYFDALREDTPHVFSSMKEKLKYFHPAFHSTTPEGLNSRLTFLLQCTRPADTIPVVQPDGEKVVVDARNTAFGAPPVCVLRIGDFYHSKILISDVNINYEDNVWDMNPEGIGYQPMIANININFKFIGGQGIEKPVAELQNALSSNYFANTEMYDYRSTATENRDEFNKVFLQRLVESQPNIKTSDITYVKQNTYGDPIGKFVTNVTSSNQASGTLSYTDTINDAFENMNRYLKTSSDYFTTLYNNYGKTVASMVLADTNRIYTSGNFLGTTMNIFGLHQDVNLPTHSKISDLSETVVSDIESMNFDVFTKIKNQLSTNQYNVFKNNFESKFKSSLKERLLILIKKDIENGEAVMYKNGVNLINSFDKLNFVNQKLDGTYTKEKVVEYTLTSTGSGIIQEYFSPYLSDFNSVFTEASGKLDNTSISSITEDMTWRVNIVATLFDDKTINDFMGLFGGLGDAKVKKIKELLKNYLITKKETLSLPKSINPINKTVEFPFTEDLSTPNKDTIVDIFSPINVSSGGTFNYSKLIR